MHTLQSLPTSQPIPSDAGGHTPQQYMWTLGHFPYTGPQKRQKKQPTHISWYPSLIHMAAKSWNNPADTVTNPRPWYLFTQPILNNFSFNNELLLLSLFIDVRWEWYASVQLQITPRNPLNLLKTEANIKSPYKQLTTFRQRSWGVYHPVPTPTDHTTPLIYIKQFITSPCRKKLVSGYAGGSRLTADHMPIISLCLLQAFHKL